MNQERFLGLQWKLAAIYLAASLLSTAMVAAGYYGGTALGMAPTPALGVGIGAGLAVGLAGALYGSLVARRLKLRLWEAGDMALRIARGDLSARVTVGAPDEVGLLEEQLNQMAAYLQEAETRLRGLVEQNRQLAEEAWRGAALEERARLARDLHDTVNQQLFVLSLRTAAARKKLEKLGGESAAFVPELSALEELARQAHSQTRELILQLRPTTLEQQGLGAALAEYARSVSSRESWELEAAIDTSIRLGGSPGEALFRIAQEALNNVAKHARASRVRVELSREPEGIRLRVADDGIGFDRRAGVSPTSVGLVGMQERVAALGGQIRVRSRPGEGTEVDVLLPVPHETPVEEGGTPS
ncbi:MAG: HAMP domain-containing sensor histidine kinase [Bacillota bacterium]